MNWKRIMERFMYGLIIVAGVEASLFYYDHHMSKSLPDAGAEQHAHKQQEAQSVEPSATSPKTEDDKSSAKQPEAVTVSASSPSQAQPSFEVKHQLQGDDLHLNLTVKNFRFSLENMGKDNKHGEGHVHLYLDSKKVAKIFDSTYVYKDVPAGKHTIMLELANNDHSSYGVKKTLTIEVK
ncbi:hypothetical protein [Brevibacillus dissolubilis]|uniref:hypothetical protein n=1 Tax=Brevibacillus dissolubilis TaxID=1844116 RepID=UPI0011170C80|nr:hypothetical protein [Brevibacillus dissolubilis]